MPVKHNYKRIPSFGKEETKSFYWQIMKFITMANTLKATDSTDKLYVIKVWNVRATCQPRVKKRVKIRCVINIQITYIKMGSCLKWNKIKIRSEENNFDKVERERSISMVIEKTSEKRIINRCYISGLKKIFKVYIMKTQGKATYIITKKKLITPLSMLVKLAVNLMN